jgi:vitamin K-dependent gamma-carboxylase
MMVHSWHTQHIKIAFVDKNTNKTHYLNPKAWTTSKRWTSHADMLHQYAKCIEKKLNSYNYTNIELYIDVWRSMNHRFNQRQLDPRVDLLKAEWSPFKQTSWLMPLLTELSDWRTKMHNLEKEVEEKKLDVDLTFVADFPGLVLENYVAAGLNTTIEVLHGKVNVELVDQKKNYTLNVGEKVDVPSGRYHNVYTISDTPSCFLYIYRNETSTLYSRLFSNYKKNMDEIYNRTLERLRDSEPDRSYGNILKIIFLF